MGYTTSSDLFLVDSHMVAWLDLGDPGNCIGEVDSVYSEIFSPTRSTGSSGSSASLPFNNEYGQWLASGTFTVYCTCGGHLMDLLGGTSEIFDPPQPPQCAVPTNFQKTSTQDMGGGTLRVVYNWQSSSGSLSDLAACSVGEIVEYDPANLPFPPPFPLLSPPNPTVVNNSGSLGGIQDNHSTPGTFRTPYMARSVVASQVNRYSCPCSNGGAWTTLMGPLTIVRSVEQVAGGSWRFTITKDGDQATMALP
jgi:hypothetical protein